MFGLSFLKTILQTNVKQHKEHQNVFFENRGFRKKKTRVLEKKMIKRHQITLNL